MSEPAQNRRPNILLVMTDQLHYPPAYESDELAEYRREHCAGQERLRENGVSFTRHYPISAACAPSRASLLTGPLPLAARCHADRRDLPRATTATTCSGWRRTTVPTLGDWFRAGGYRTYYKGKWHASHAHLDADDGDGLPALDRRRRQADRGEHQAVPRGRSARRVRLLGVGRPRAARTRQAQHRHGQGPVHRRRDDRAARSASTPTRATSRG